MSAPTLYERIREAILTLELAPGQRLSERGLEPEFGASRTPVRAALMRLESDGLVRRDGKGWVVAPLDIDEIRSLYEYREVLETASVRLASERATPADLETVVSLASNPRNEESQEHSVEAGTNFHLELARLSENEFLYVAMEGVLTRLYRTRWLEVRTPESRARAHSEHETVTTALLARDAVAAESAMREHLRGTGARLVDSLLGSRLALRGQGITMNAVD
jgi:DNA-binding GntR family transcriptional regulator